MKIFSVKMATGRISPYITKSKQYIKKTAVAVTMCTSALLPVSCYFDYEPSKINNNDDITKVKVSDDIILPDTVTQPILQDIHDIHERINEIFTSLKIIDKNKNIQDIKTIEFLDADNNSYKYTDIQETDNGYEFIGTVNHNGVEENTVLKLYDGLSLINKPFVCVETSFNTKHNFSMIYQTHWRLGADMKPERRLFQNRTNQVVSKFNKKEYYPYDVYNIFALRKTEDGISSKCTNEKFQFSPDDEIKGLKIIYK